MTAPTSKSEMYEMYNAGAFGNKLLTWDTLEDYERSGYIEPVVLRYKQQGSKFCAYGVSKELVREKVAEFVAQGADISKICFNEMADDNQLTFQGEVSQSEDYLHLRFTTVAKPMRLAMEECAYDVKGYQATSTLHKYLDYDDYEWLMHLLESYQSDNANINPVAEFSVFKNKCGTWDRRMVVWELRAY